MAPPVIIKFQTTLFYDFIAQFFVIFFLHSNAAVHWVWQSAVDMLVVHWLWGNASVSLYRDCLSSLCWWVLNQISKLLAQEPYTRITASEALSHPFIRQDDSSLPPPRIIIDQVSRPSSLLRQRIICTVFCVMGISWKDRITNLEVRTRTGQQTMDNILRERRLHWLGHVFHMDHQRIPQQALYWQVPGYKRGPGRPRANWRGVVSKDLRKMGSPGRKQRWQLLTDTDGIGVWPYVSSWIQAESRSRSRFMRAMYA